MSPGPKSNDRASRPQRPEDAPRLAELVRDAVANQPLVDVHTHLCPPTFGSPLPGRGGKLDPDGLLLWGIDELITYHYLVCEVFRVVPPSQMPYARFWAMSKSEQADHIWKHLFVDRSPISEACRGVVTTLQMLGLDPAERSLERYRRWFADQQIDEHIDRVMELSGVTRITMTNDVFDDNERRRWLQDASIGDDPRFTAVLRFDMLVRDWTAASQKLSDWGYETSPELSAKSIEAGRRFLRDWIERTKSVYSAVSLPPEFRYGGPDDKSDTAVVLRQIVMPVLEEAGLPFAMMIGSIKQLNPELQLAGDMVGMSDIMSLARMCLEFPYNKFLVTMLARENQQELCVLARKFGNLMIFGCWWWLNNPSLVEEITRMRVELLGTTFIPQHSDARVLEQLVYKWDHSRAIIGEVLAEKYADLAEAGWVASEAEIRRDIREMLDGHARTMTEPRA
ncbi:MAG: hypothetical protein AB7G28_03480 [Pirellulales bacterium]